jgi:ribosomal-protein-alanine N-acetyltransferase
MKDIFLQPMPIFELSNGFILGDIKPEVDGEDYFYYMNQPQVRPFISTGNLPATIAKAKEDLQYWSSLFNLHKGFYWAIRNEQNQKLVGTLGFNNLSFVHSKGEISYDLSVDYWKKGIMTKAINKIVDFGLNKIGLVRVQAHTAKRNKSSIKLLERCKFKSEGLLRKFELLGGEHVDYFIYALVK